MKVMDLSLPKPEQNPPHAPQTAMEQQHQHQYALQQQYLLQQQQHFLHLQRHHHYAPYPPVALLPSQPSINHLGFFQQVHYASPPQDASRMTVTSSGSGSPMRQEHNISPPIFNSTSPSLYPAHSPPTAELVEVKHSERREKEVEGTHKHHTKRPFKLIATSKTPTSLTMPIIDPNSSEAYEAYRNKVLSQMEKTATESNRNMRRTIPSNPEKCNDPEYIERRKKNNEAAKKSREARKAKEDEIAIRVSFLEQENLKLKFQLATIERQKKVFIRRLEEQQKRTHGITACF